MREKTTAFQVASQLESKEILWLTATQVATLLNIHVNTLKRIPYDNLPYIRVSTRGDRRYNISDIEQFIQSEGIRYSKKS
jgi:hypothetical protein